GAPAAGRRDVRRDVVVRGRLQRPRGGDRRRACFARRGVRSAGPCRRPRPRDRGQAAGAGRRRRVRIRDGRGRQEAGRPRGDDVAARHQCGVGRREDPGAFLRLVLGDGGRVRALAVLLLLAHGRRAARDLEGALRLGGSARRAHGRGPRGDPVRHLHRGQGLIERWVLSMNLSPLGFQFLAQVIIFLLGWPLEWTEIIVIFCPIFIPLLTHFNVDPILFGTMVAVNLQAAFLSPPVAMSAFYLKGVSPRHVTLNQIFAGMMPYMVIVCICLVFMYVWPGMTLWLPEFLYGK